MCVIANKHKSTPRGVPLSCPALHSSVLLASPHLHRCRTFLTLPLLPLPKRPISFKSSTLSERISLSLDLIPVCPTASPVLAK